jgi:hypothetical protein
MDYQGNIVSDQEKIAEIIQEADDQVKGDGFIPSDEGTQHFLSQQGIFVSLEEIRQALSK